MDVLNTYGGDSNYGYLIVWVLFCLAGGYLGAYALECFGNRRIFDGIIHVGLVALILTAAISAFTLAFQPVRHEVTLQPGYVIDAEKYELIEKRGEIYVIEPKEGVE